MSKHLKFLIGLLASLFVSFLAFGIFVPIRLSVDNLVKPWYGDMALSSENSDVNYVSLFGVKLKAKDVYASQSYNGTYMLRSHDLSLTGSLKMIKPSDTKIEYDGTVYVGQKLDTTKLKISAVYDDTTRDVTSFTVTATVIPMATSAKVPITTNYGVVNFSVEPSMPESVSAIYDTDTKMGDTFDKSKVVVKLVYSDGTEYELKDFVIPDAPVYISGDVKINVITEYGDTVLNIVPSDSQKLSIKYDGTVYVGDKLDSSKVKISGVGEDGSEFIMTDFTVDDVGVVKTNVNVSVHSKLGDITLNIKSIPIKKCEAVLNGDIVVGNKLDVKSINITYDDDKVVSVLSSDVVFTNKSLIYGDDEMTVWFTYHSVYCSFTVGSIPDNIAILRGGDSSIPRVSTKYDLTDDQVSKIAVLCQRIASNDISLAAAEASMIANRYELYSSDKSVSGDALLSYIYNSEYWGNDVADYVSTYIAQDGIKDIVKTVLVDGYRTLPVNVDERKNQSDFTSDSAGLGIMTSGSTVISDSNNVQYVFYSYPSSNSNVMYCIKK